MAAKRRKKHKNKIARLVISICYNGQNSKFWLFSESIIIGCTKITHKGLSFFRDCTWEKCPLKGSKHPDNLYRFQVSGVRFPYLTSPFPDTSYETSWISIPFSCSRWAQPTLRSPQTTWRNVGWVAPTMIATGRFLGQRRGWTLTPETFIFWQPVVGTTR